MEESKGASETLTKPVPYRHVVWLVFCVVVGCWVAWTFVFNRPGPPTLAAFRAALAADDAAAWNRWYGTRVDWEIPGLVRNNIKSWYEVELDDNTTISVYPWWASYRSAGRPIPKLPPQRVYRVRGWLYPDYNDIDISGATIE